MLTRFSGISYALMRVVVGFLFACHGAQKLFGVLGGQIEIHDPQGEAISRACQRLGYGDVVGVRQGKRFELELRGEADDNALTRVGALAGDSGHRLGPRARTLADGIRQIRPGVARAARPRVRG